MPTDPDAVAQQTLINQVTSLSPIATVKLITTLPMQIEGTLDDKSPYFFRARGGTAVLSITAPGRNPLDPTASTMSVDYQNSIDLTTPYEVMALFTALLTKHGRPPTNARQARAHSLHCCARHGCKYDDARCPVVLGQRQQEFPCEACEHDPAPPDRTVLVIEGDAVTDRNPRDLLVLGVFPDGFREQTQPSQGEFVELLSVHDDRKHRALRPLIGRRLRVTVELVDACPRCLGPLSRRPATSRTDNQTLICVDCGTDEGLRDTNREPLPPQEGWPVEGRYALAAAQENAGGEPE